MKRASVGERLGECATAGGIARARVDGPKRLLGNLAAKEYRVTALEAYGRYKNVRFGTEIVIYGK